MKNRRKSRQREVILKVLRNTDSHPTADWVYEQVKKEVPNISLGTVYRNLRLLTEAGEIMELEFGSTYSRFDGRAENHYHFRCDVCGRVFDLDMPVMEELEDRARQAGGFEVSRHRLEFYGRCPDCAGD